MIYSVGTSSSPSWIWTIKSCGALPSTVQPTECAVPRISRMVPVRSRAPDRGLMVRAMLIMSSMVMLPLCWTKIWNESSFHLIGLDYACKLCMVLTVLDLLSVTWWFLEGLDDHRRCGWNNGDLKCSLTGLVINRFEWIQTRQVSITSLAGDQKDPPSHCLRLIHFWFKNGFSGNKKYYFDVPEPVCFEW